MTMASKPQLPRNPRLVSLAGAVALRRSVARRGGRFVLTNGVFDLLHPGHTSYLEKARALAGKKGVLVVALNSDASVRRLKGPSRPVLDERSRAYSLAQLRSVDAVVIFRAKRLTREIAALRPDVYTKAGDYTLATMDPSERRALEKAGSRIVFMPFLKGLSTTGLIRRIRAAGSL
jgi:D-glycero-beta-D-manno-heptose 1-phosphate adenylyltransferase